MKKILFSLLFAASFFAAFGQSTPVRYLVSKVDTTVNAVITPLTGYGGIYYNSLSNKFRIYENGVWRNWGASASGLTIGSTSITGGTSGRLLTSGATVGEQTLGTNISTFLNGTKPTTIGGYGITDFNSLGDARWLQSSTLGTGVSTALGINVGSAGSFVVNGGALGTPSSGVATNLTGLPISTGVSGLGTGVSTWLGTPSWANFNSAITGTAPYWPLGGAASFTDHVVMDGGIYKFSLSSAIFSVSSTLSSGWGEFSASATSPDGTQSLTMNPNINSLKSTTAFGENLNFTTIRNISGFKTFETYHTRYNGVNFSHMAMRFGNDNSSNRRFSIHFGNNGSETDPSSIFTLTPYFFVDENKLRIGGTLEGNTVAAVSTSNQLVLGATRTVTIHAPTPATASRVWTVPDLSADQTFVGLTGSQALTNKSVNGVTLTTGGSATDFLNATGTYTAPSGGGTVTNVSSANANATVATQTTTPVITIVNSPAVGGITITGTPSVGQSPVATSSSAATWQTPASGFADPMTTRGDLIFRNASNVTARLAIGTSGQVPTSDGTDISWSTPTAATLTTPRTIGITTGDVTSAGSTFNGSANNTNNLTIANDAVTYAKMQNISAASRLLGRGDSGSGDPEQLTLGTNLSITGTTLNASGGGMAIGSSITSATAGSVLFAGAAGVLEQDNASLFFNDTNNRLGIGTDAPDNRLHVRGSGANIMVNVESTSSGFASAFQAKNDAGSVFQMGKWGTAATPYGAILVGNSYVYGAGRTIIAADGASGIIVFGTGSGIDERFRISADGAWGLNGATYGTSGQVVTSSGPTSIPTWTTPNVGTVTSVTSANGNATIATTTTTPVITIVNSPAVGGITITGTPSVGQVPTATSASAATWQNPEILTTKVTVSSAEILALNATAKTLVAAPGVGKIIEVIGLSFRYNYLTAAYATHTTLDLLYTTVSVATFSGIIDQTSNKLKLSSGVNPAVTDTATIENQSLALGIASGVPTGGGGSLDVYITYRIITL